MSCWPQLPCRVPKCLRRQKRRGGPFKPGFGLSGFRGSCRNPNTPHNEHRVVWATRPDRDDVRISRTHESEPRKHRRASVQWQLLLDLVESGISREDAYRLVQSHAMHSWKEGLNFREEICKDPSITGRVPAKAIQRAVDLKRQLRKLRDFCAGVWAKKPATQKRRKS